MERRGKVQKGGCWFCCHRRQTTVSVKSNQQEVGEVIWSKQKVYRKSIGGQNEEVSKTSLEFLCSCTLASRSDIWPGSHKMCKDTQNVSSWCVIQNFRPKWAKKIVFQCFARKKACLYKFATKIQHERCEASLFLIRLPNEHLSRIQRKNIFQNLWFRRFQSKFSGKRPKKGQKKGPAGLNASKKDRLFFHFFKRRPSPTRCLASRMSFGYPHPTGRWPKTRTAEWKKLFLYKGFCLQKYQQEPGYIRIGIRMIISPPLIWISDSRIGCVE